MPSSPPIELRPTADGTAMLARPDLDEGYHSNRGALAEARHVFLEASGAAARAVAGVPTAILEIGLGSGLNAIVTWAAFAAGNAPLRYVGIESDPVPAAWFDRLGYADLDPTAPELIDWLRAFAAAPPGGRLTLAQSPREATALRADALRAAPEAPFDIVYLDAFSPNSAPALWTDAALARWRDYLRPSGVLVTYCAQGAFRRRLRDLGMRVERLPGPPAGKREMTRALR